MFFCYRYMSLHPGCKTNEATSQQRNLKQRKLSFPTRSLLNLKHQKEHTFPPSHFPGFFMILPIPQASRPCTPLQLHPLRSKPRSPHSLQAPHSGPSAHKGTKRPGHGPRRCGSAEATWTGCGVVWFGGFHDRLVGGFET